MKSRKVVSNSLGLMSASLILSVFAISHSAEAKPEDPPNYEQWQCRTYGATATGNYFNICAKPYFNGAYVSLQSALQFGSDATAATGCKITGYLRLSDNDVQWKSPKVTRNCTEALKNRDDFFYYQHFEGGTAALLASARVCIDLAFNGSSSSSVQICFDHSNYPLPF